MQLMFPIHGKNVGDARQLIQNKRFLSGIEQFPVSLEIISDTNINSYVNLLLDQNKNSDKAMQDYIARIPFTKEGQQLFRSLSTGWWNNSFSITLIAHKKFDDHHKVLIAKLSKEVTLSFYYKLLSPLSTIFGMTVNEHKQIEAILTNLNQESNKETMENTMMLIMAESLHDRFSNHIDIDYI